MKQIKLNAKVQIKVGKFKGEIGEVIKTGGGQYDVQFVDGSVRYYNFNDLEVK